MWHLDKHHVKRCLLKDNLHVCFPLWHVWQTDNMFAHFTLTTHTQCLKPRFSVPLTTLEKGRFSPKLRDKIDKDSDMLVLYAAEQTIECQLLNVGTQYSPSFPSSFLPFVGTQYYGETGHSEFKILATVKYTSHVLLNVFVVKHICC